MVVQVTDEGDGLKFTDSISAERRS